MKPSRRQAPRARPFEADAVLRTAQAGDVTRAVRWLETLLSRGFLDTERLGFTDAISDHQWFLVVRLSRLLQGCIQPVSDP